MQLCFVSTSRGSQFMTELLAAISEAAATDGHRTELVLDAFPDRPDECVYVVIPHEFDAWGDPAGFPDPAQRARTIALCTENRGTEWFEATYRLVPQYAAAVSINRLSAAELQQRGIRCKHIQLGYAPAWDSWRRDEGAAREIDVLYLGAADPRRDPILAGLGRDLAERQCQLLVPPLEPRTAQRADFLTGDEKYHRLRSARVLLNLHRTTSAALEWMRFIEAIGNGCVVVSEPCLDAHPLIPGEHFIEADVEHIGPAIAGLLDDPARLRLMRDRAYEFIRASLPMQSASRGLVELAAELPRDPPAAGEPHAQATRQTAGPTAEPAGAEDKIASDASVTVGRRAPLLKRAIAKRIFSGRERMHVRSPSYGKGTPRVSVVSVAMPGHDMPALQRLDWLTAPLARELELLVAGNAESAARLQRTLPDHPALAFACLPRNANEAIGASYNRLIERARGDYVLVLEPTGGIFPATIARLAAALDYDPGAYFAYPMVAVLEGERPVRLRSSLPWEPERLRRDDWIDATALLRRARLAELGGFTSDPQLAGWQAFDLWCRCAEAGGYGLHIPQVLAWHCRSTDTLSAEHDAPATLHAVMADRHPRVFGQS